MATIADVARIAGVSQSTVSHVINGTRFVKPETEQAVRDAVARTGYTPNTLARALARSSSNSVGIAISAISNPYFADIIRAVESECAACGMTVFLADTHDTPEKELEVVQALHQLRVDGIIIAPCSTEGSGALRYLEDHGIPTVLVDRLASTKFDQVGVQNAKSMEVLVEHLVELGHTRIGMIPGHTGFATTLERIDGFVNAARHAKLQASECTVARSSNDVDSAARATIEMMSHAACPTALVAGNNMTTIGIMRGLKSLGKHVPDDIALVGFDDFEWADCFEPRLTVIAQPCIELGRRSAKLLLDRIKDPGKTPKTIRVKTSFIVRNSCGSANR